MESTPHTAPPPTRALTSASNLLRRKLCQGSANMERGMPAENSPWSAEGDLLHHKDAHPDEPRNDLVRDQIAALDRNRALREKFISDVMAAEGIDASAERVDIVEREFFLCDENGIPVMPDFPGHPDRVVYFPRHKVAIITDSKFGRIAVSRAETNLQLRCYTVMFSENFECLKVFAAITQPFLSGADAFHAVVYEPDDIVNAKREILEILELNKNPNAPLSASMEACTYCRAKTVCPKAYEVVSELALVKIKGMPVHELEQKFEACTVAIKVYDQMKSRLKDIALRQPEALKIFELGPPEDAETVVDAEQAFAILYDMQILPKDPVEARQFFMRACKMSLPSMTDLIARFKSMEHDKVRANLDSALAPVIISTPKDRKLRKKKML